MASFVKFESFTLKLGQGSFNFGSDTLKIALTNSAPNASTHTVLADITQISGTNGYTTGGSAVASVSWTGSGGTASLTGTDLTFTSSSGNMGPLRYAVLYDDTASSDPLIGYWDRASSVTLDGTSGDTVTIDFSATIITVA